MLSQAVSAGNPQASDSQYEFSLDEYFANHCRGEVRYIHVKNGSMVEAGILPGAILILNTRKSLKDADDVLIKVNNTYRVEPWASIVESKKRHKLYVVPQSGKLRKIENNRVEDIKIIGSIEYVINRHNPC